MNMANEDGRKSFECFHWSFSREPSPAWHDAIGGELLKYFEANFLRGRGNFMHSWFSLEDVKHYFHRAWCIDFPPIVVVFSSRSGGTLSRIVGAAKPLFSLENKRCQTGFIRRGLMEMGKLSERNKSERSIKRVNQNISLEYIKSRHPHHQIDEWANDGENILLNRRTSNFSTIQF